MDVHDTGIHLRYPAGCRCLRRIVDIEPCINGARALFVENEGVDIELRDAGI
jgi:hypothetical protein